MQIISLRFSQALCTRGTLGGGPPEGPRLLSSCPGRTQSAQAKRYEAVRTSTYSRGSNSCHQPSRPGGWADWDVGENLLRTTA